MDCWHRTQLELMVILSAVIAKDPNALSSWTPLWYMCAGVALSGAICFLVLGTGEEQPWNKLDCDEELLVPENLDDELADPETED